MTQPYEQVSQWLQSYQAELMAMLEQEDGKQTFTPDTWSYDDVVQSDASEHKKPQGGGKTCVLRDGKIFESAGVNFSAIGGASLPKAATNKRQELADKPFKATGVSTVVHPDNPMVPTCHANFRLLTVGDNIWWFGGGFDLTPFYGFDEDCVLWHQAAKAACDRYGEAIYPRFKKWCDDYFYLPHRQEQRGIGGLFFDDLNDWPFEQCFACVQDVAKAFLQAYQAIVQRRKCLAFTPEQKQFQLLRRGRYVEFNLLYDRGTLFGLQSHGRTESILMSLPANVQWTYNYRPVPGSEEEKLLTHFLRPQDWASCD